MRSQRVHKHFPRSRHCEDVHHRILLGDSRMSTSEIIRKLTDELDKGITTEVQTVYLLAGIRKLIERDSIEGQYADLKFHCDWALHSSMEHAAARQILRKFDAAHALLREGVALHKLPRGLRSEIDRISKMRSFEKELAEFLTAYGLPPITKISEDGWPHFLHLYTRVIEDIPLTVSVPAGGEKKNKAKQSTSDGGPTHMSRVTFHLEPARKETQHGNREDVLFKVTWRIHDKNGKTGVVFVINSYSTDDLSDARLSL